MITVADLRHATGFSYSGVFVDYLLASIAAFTHPVADRRCPKARQAIGALASIALVVTLPPASVLTGVDVLLLASCCEYSDNANNGNFQIPEKLR
ncbi:hypothetical protein [Paeniglutamicibacter terrestris]|uniref:Uncharacterized protein n=1 Tax=Paeniglutamicibacter terrestris TaxID=2723403 RepID=A0ABX1G5C7_9MICC|nr:hypothetical protein [Paeniglutamicibacter terrestris]NKG20911.1 hypothetical protein [Paeniglutamicibacter terrestris]